MPRLVHCMRASHSPEESVCRHMSACAAIPSTSVRGSPIPARVSLHLFYLPESFQAENLTTLLSVLTIPFCFPRAMQNVTGRIPREESLGLSTSVRNVLCSDAQGLFRLRFCGDGDLAWRTGKCCPNLAHDL